MKKVMRILALCLSLVLSLSLLAACGGGSGSTPSGDQQETITLVFSMSDPETSAMNTDIFQPWFQKIEEATGGRVKIECHYNEELVAVTDAYDAVCKGTVDMAFVRNSMIASGVLDNLIENTYPTNSCTQSALVYNMLYEEFPEMAAQYSEDCTWMLHYQMTPAYIGVTSDTPVASMSDLTGKKFITGSLLQTTTTSALGAAAVDVLPPDFYTSLEKGVADGALTTTMPEMINYSWADVIHGVTKAPMLQACAGVIINTDKWNSLPEDIRQIITDMQDEIIAMTDKAINDMQASALEKLAGEEYNVTIVEPSEELLAELTAVSEQVIADELARLDAEGYKATEIYTRWRELTEQYAG